MNVFNNEKSEGQTTLKWWRRAIWPETLTANFDHKRNGQTEIDYTDFRNSFLESKQFSNKGTNYDSLKKQVYFEISIAEFLRSTLWIAITIIYIIKI